MNSVPLHPAVVHAPLVLAVALPLVALGVLIALLRGRAGRRAWWGVVALQGLFVGSVVVAIETGEQDEHRVEKVTGEAPVETHEHHAKRFLKASGANLALAAVAGFAPMPALPAAAALSTIGSVVVAGLGVSTGKSGGELVYVHGAAGAPPARGADAATAAPLVSQHAQLAAGLDRLERHAESIGEGAGSDPARREVLAFLNDHLLPHAGDEEKGLYHAVDRRASRGVPFTSAMRHEHKVVTRRVQELAATAGGRLFARRLDQLIGILRTHFELEEVVLLPVLGREHEAAHHH